jgi:hypothetical protein
MGQRREMILTYGGSPDVILLASIKVDMVQPIVPDSKDDRDADAMSKASLVVDAPAITREVCYEQATLTNLHDDAIINLLVVLQEVEADRRVPCHRKSGLETL